MPKKKTVEKAHEETGEQPDIRLSDVCQMIVELREQLDKVSVNSGVRVKEYKIPSDKLK